MLSNDCLEPMPQYSTFPRLEVTITTSYVSVWMVPECPSHLLGGISKYTNVKWSQTFGLKWLQTNTPGNPCKSVIGSNEFSPFLLYCGSTEHQINPPWQLYSRKKLIEGVGLHSVKFIVTLIRTSGHKWPSHRHAWLTVMLIKITRIIKSMLLYEPLYKH